VAADGVFVAAAAAAAALVEVTFLCLQQQAATRMHWLMHQWRQQQPLLLRLRGREEWLLELCLWQQQ
jgi:hypothetical protein